MENDNITTRPILESRLKGIMGCVRQYTKDPWINEAMNSLEIALEERDAETLIQQCKELHGWYNLHIGQVLSNPYVTNKIAHQVCHKELPKIVMAIESHPEWFKLPTEESSICITTTKSKRILISHATADRAPVSQFVDLLRSVGFSEKHIICSSYPGFGIPMGENIFEFLKSCFNDYELFVLLMGSRTNYYASPACLNEMGAAWVTGAITIPILLPGMTPAEMKGAIGMEKLALVIDDEDAKYRLNELKDKLLSFFSMDAVNESSWEHARDHYLKSGRGF